MRQNVNVLTAERKIAYVILSTMGGLFFKHVEETATADGRGSDAKFDYHLKVTTGRDSYCTGLFRAALTAVRRGTHAGAEAHYPLLYAAIVHLEAAQGKPLARLPRVDRDVQILDYEAARTQADFARSLGSGHKHG